MAETEYIDVPIPGLEPYITLRVVGFGDDTGIDIEMESGNGFTKETAMEFLKVFVNGSEEA